MITIFFKENHQCCNEKMLIIQTKSKVKIITCEGCGLIFSSDHPINHIDTLESIKFNGYHFWNWHSGFWGGVIIGIIMIDIIILPYILLIV